MRLGFLCIATALIATQASGQADLPQAKIYSLTTPIPADPLWVMNGFEPIFKLGPGGCLVGPLAIFDPAGHMQFKLDAGIEYPAGCSSAPREAK